MGRRVPRLRLRRPGHRRLVLDRRHHLDGRSLRAQRRLRRPRVGLGGQQPLQPLLRPHVHVLEQLRRRRRRAVGHSLRRRRPDLGLARDRQRRLHPQRADHRRPRRLRLRRLDERGRRRARQPHEHDLPLDERRRDLDLLEHRCLLPGPGPVDLWLLRRHVPLLLAAHGLGRHRRRPRREHPLRLRPARRGLRLRRRLLRALDRQRLHLVGAAADEQDGGTRCQWQPSLSVSPGGHVLVSWYDARNTTGNSFSASPGSRPTTARPGATTR